MTKLQRYIITCIIFLAFLPLVYQFMYPNLTTNELFSKSFVAPKLLVTYHAHRSNSTEDSPQKKTPKTLKQKALYYEAAKAYSKKEYASTVLLFKRYLQQTPTDRKEIALYLGVAYLEIEQLEAAQREFQFLIKNGSTQQKQDAQWYLVLTLLKKGEIEQVWKLLTEMTTQVPTHAYQEKAQILLETIQQQP